jgi:hypothetical protein
MTQWDDLAELERDFNRIGGLPNYKRVNGRIRGGSRIRRSPR